MNYRDFLHALDTQKALEILGVPTENKGSYLKFSCPKCNEPALFKTFGDKKNLYYCPKCKTGGNIIKFAMALKGLDWEGAKTLLEKAITKEPKEITEELKLPYVLEYNKFLEDQGIPEALCTEYEIGQPKGRTMLSGCIAFAVHNDKGMKVAYWGLTMKDRKPKFHTSFSPEAYLYGFHRIDKEREVVVWTSLLGCVKGIVEGKQGVSTFELAYLSQRQLELLNQCKTITAFRADAEVVRQLSSHFNGFVRFIG